MLITESASMQALRREMVAAAHTETPVVICGEPGAGKAFIASVIHRMSPRRSCPFVVFDGRGLPDLLVHSELFGHLEGGFAGAFRAKRGLVWRTHRGSLFVSSHETLPLRAQSLLTTLARSGDVWPLGADAPQGHVDVRLCVAGTAAQGAPAWCAGLTPMMLRVPPLRTRRADILSLVRHFLTMANATMERPSPAVSADAKQLLLEYEWPGNVRQLKTVMSQLAARPARVIDADAVAEQLGLTHANRRHTYA